jgi:ketosteroid isomerase-like protein
MPSPLHVALATIAFAFIFSANVSTANAQQKSLTPDQKQVVDTVNTIFSAASTEDIAKLDSVTAPDFYIFANGMRPHGCHQSPTRRRQAHRRARDRTRHPHPWQYCLDRLRQ